MPGPIHNPRIATSISDKSVTGVGSTSTVAEANLKKDKIASGEIKKSDSDSTEIQDKQSLDVQCFLIDNVLQIAKGRIWPWSFPEYSSFTMIEAHGGGPGDVAQEVLSRKGIKELFNLSSAQKALLIPKIEIYKIISDKDGGNPKDVRLIFADSMRNKEVESIISGKKGRGDDVGLKSFSYVFDATQPAEGGRVKTTLTLVFQNASGFTEKRDNGVTFSDLIWDKESVSPAGVSFNSIAFRLKIVSGWAVPSDPGNVLFSKELMKAIENTKSILFVTHIKHDLEFNEDGTLKVTIEYCGAIDIALGDTVKSNIFGGTNDRLQKFIDKVKKNVDTLDKKEVSISSSPNQSGDAAKNTATESAKLSERDSLAILESIDKQDKYSRLIKDLYDSSSMYYVDIDSTMIEAVDDKKKEYIEKKIKEQKQVEKVEASEIEAAVINDRLKSRRVSKLQVNKVAPGEQQKKFGEAKRALTSAIREAIEVNAEYKMSWWTGEETASVKKKSEKEMNQVINSIIRVAAPSERLESPKDGSPSKIRVYYFYLGDLLDIVFKKFVTGRKDLNNMRILLGTLVYTDPRTKKQEEVSIADIPIALERFVTWYTKKIIATQPQVYLVSQFIRDILEQIVIAALGDNCFGRLSQNLPNVVFTTFSTPITSKDPLSNMENGRRYSFKGGLNARPGEDLIKKSDASDSAKVQHFFYIYSNNYSLTNATGDIQEDASRGIYHLAPGLDRGLVKSIKFTKNAIAHMAETQLAPGNKVGRISPNVYNATIRMLGNSLFINGNYVYIDTTKMNLGSPFKKEFGKLQPNALAFEYHLGGYYHINKVTFDFNDFDYETILTGIWIGALPTDDDLFNMANNGLGTTKFASQQSYMKDKSLFYGNEGTEQSISSIPKVN